MEERPPTLATYVAVGPGADAAGVAVATLAALGVRVVIVAGRSCVPSLVPAARAGLRAGQPPRGGPGALAAEGIPDIS